MLTKNILISKIILLVVLFFTSTAFASNGIQLRTNTFVPFTVAFLSPSLPWKIGMGVSLLKNAPNLSSIAPSICVRNYFSENTWYYGFESVFIIYNFTNTNTGTAGNSQFDFYGQQFLLGGDFPLTSFLGWGVHAAYFVPFPKNTINQALGDLFSVGISLNY